MTTTHSREWIKDLLAQGAARYSRSFESAIVDRFDEILTESAAYNDAVRLWMEGDHGESKRLWDVAMTRTLEQVQNIYEAKVEKYLEEEL